MTEQDDDLLTNFGIVVALVLAFIIAVTVMKFIWEWML